jgi:uncharacterized protein YukE
MPQINADYDAANLYVDPDGLKGKADTLLGLAENVADSLSNIDNTLSALQLGWAGKTADEARDFGNRWEAVMKELFGSKDHPEKGVLNAIVDGLLTTRGNFSLTESGLAELFQKFGENLSGGSSETPTGPPPSINDLNVTAITETW